MNFEDFDLNNKYIKLETRLKEIISHLMLNTTEDKLDNNVLSYISLLISQGSVIPHKFFTLFELSRIETISNELINVNERQQKMIVCFYILIKILIHSILFPKLSEFSTKNPLIYK